MSDFRTRLGEQLGAAAAAPAGDRARMDFRARLGAQLAGALVELQRERVAAIVPTGVQVVPRPAATGAMPAGDVRERFGAVLTAAAAQLAGARAGLPLPATHRRRRAWAPRRTAHDFRDRLGATLTASAATLAGVRAGALRSPARAAPPRRRRRRGLVPHLARPLAVGVAAMGLAGAATASSLWLVSVGNPNGGTNPGLSATAPPPAQIAALAVLRRPQDSADRGPGVQLALEDVNDFTTGVRSDFVRVLETTAAGPVVLVPVAERDPEPAGGGIGPMADALCIYYPVVGASPLGSSPACWNTAQLLGASAVSASGGRIFGLVPDGVTSVAVAAAGAPPISAPVAGNFFDAPLPAPAPTTSLGGAPPPSKMPVVTFNRG